MTTQSLIIRVRKIDGEILIDSQAMALLFGVDAELISAHSKRKTVTGATKFPSAWIQQGRRRAREAMAHTGSEAMLDSLRYWAQRDYGAELEVVHQ